MPQIQSIASFRLHQHIMCSEVACQFQLGLMCLLCGLLSNTRLSGPGVGRQVDDLSDPPSDVGVVAPLVQWQCAVAGCTSSVCTCMCAIVPTGCVAHRCVVYLALCKQSCTCLYEAIRVEVHRKTPQLNRLDYTSAHVLYTYLSYIWVLPSL